MIPQKKLNLIEKKIQDKCLTCQGEGCSDCKAKIARIKIYALANIPIDYWLLAIKDFKGDSNFKKLISEKISKIDQMYEEGTSLAFVGSFGTGKTYAACCLLKTALMNDYTARYDCMSDVISHIVSNKEEDQNYLNMLTNVDFLVIDEFGSRWVFPSEKSEQLFGQNLEYILRTRFQNHLPTILCSNNDNIDQVLSEEFSRAFSSLRSRYIKVITVGGTDFRKKGEKGE